MLNFENIMGVLPQTLIFGMDYKTTVPLLRVRSCPRAPTPPLNVCLNAKNEIDVGSVYG